MRKFLALLLAFFMLFTLVACNKDTKVDETEQPVENADAETPADETPAEEEEADADAEAPADEEEAEADAEEPAEESEEKIEDLYGEHENRIIYGSGTEISGDWSFGSYWTNNATDNMIRGLMNDYGTVASDKAGRYMINETIVKDYQTEVNEDGTKTFTITIHDDLVFNDGSPITAENYVAGAMFFMHPTLKELGSKSTANLTYVGGAEYSEGETEVIKGFRLLDEYTFSATVVEDKIPYYYDILYASFGPFPLAMWTGEDYAVKDDGEGCYFEGDMSVDALKDKIEEARFKSEDRITAGPYNLVSYNIGSKQAVLEINPLYKGNFEGVKPQVEQIIIVKAEDATMMDAFRTGQIELLSGIIDGDKINTGLDLVNDGEFDYTTYDRAGYGKLMFQCDFGPTQFQAVRHAIAHLLDRQEFANKFTGGFGGVVHGPYGLAQWMYQEAEEDLDERLNQYPFDVDEAIRILEEDGWVLDAKGGEYKEGVRYKEVTPEEAGDYEHNIEVDGKILMPLVIEWSSTENNPVSELLATMLANDTAPKAGFDVRQNIMTFEELLNWMYRDSSVNEQYGVPKYGMFNLASNFTPRYDYSYSFTLDPEMLKQGYNVNFILDEELDKLSMDMVFGVEPGDDEKFLEVWTDFIAKWNELLPEVPLYSNEYYTFFADKLKDYEESPFWGFDQAIVYAHIEK
ncbi:MAG: ABC transporter substrate-binding protein [Eubacteriales bacterium]|nr:ABC transporter substrate-binding protein [Eubacteriales bacterium]